MTKAHIVISPDPLPSGSTQEALCRTELKNFQWRVQVEPPEIRQRCGEKFAWKFKTYICRLPKGHAGDHDDAPNRANWRPEHGAKEFINPLTTCRICYQQDWPDGYLYLAKSGESRSA